MTLPGAGLAVADLHKSYADGSNRVVAVDGVSFEVPQGAFYTLLGPSGCGKTTTLRCVAGLERHDGGTITVGGQLMSASQPRTFVPPNRRDIGMVFQSYAIWPHMSVAGNVAFPLRAAKLGLSGREIEGRVKDALERVQLGGYEQRGATQLSGGQQQRLALARALVRKPRLLLLDEPLSNLDARLREQMRTELRDLQRGLGITTLYVTHDQTEALSMSDTIAVMSHGRIVQEGAPQDIYERPATRFVAQFVGTTNLVEAEVLGAVDGGRVRLRTPAGDLDGVAPASPRPGDKVSVSIRPENVMIRPADGEEAGGANRLAAIVEQVIFLGEFLDVRVRAGEVRLLLRSHPSAAVRAGDPVALVIAPEAVAVVRDDADPTRAATQAA